MEISAFTGELGGILAISFGAGCVSGWTFALQTTVKDLKEKITVLKIELDLLRDELRLERVERLREWKSLAAHNPQLQAVDVENSHVT